MKGKLSNLNQPAYPTSGVFVFQGLTKLELVSTLILQGILANQTFPILASDEVTSLAIKKAKELLSSIEDSNNE